MSQTHFHSGDQVEVTRSDSGGPTGVYYSATVLRPVTHIFVQYKKVTAHKADGDSGIPKPLTEMVELGNVRPAPPRELHRLFEVGDDVDAFIAKGWSRGTVREILENSKYLAVLDGQADQKFEFNHFNLRLHREWDDGCWDPPLPEEQRSSGMVHSRKVRFKVKAKKKTVSANFKNGTVVEVCSDEDGYKDAWHTARIVEYIGKDKFLVEYMNLVTDDDETQLLREEAFASYIRPCPPPLPPVARFELHQKVDAWYNEGWWEGSIYKVLTGSKYAVYFSSTNEELEFKHSD